MFARLLLHSGLGNQLFMIFAIISYSIDNNINYIIHQITNNKFYWYNFLTKINNKNSYAIDKNLPLYEEKEFKYNKIDFYDKEINIKGYFQSYKYFENNYEKILDITGIKEKKEDIYIKYINLFNKKSIAIHFRFGDYIGLQNNHPLMPPDYFINSLKYLEDTIEDFKNHNIYYFCQDIDNDIVNKYLECINENSLSGTKYDFIKIKDNIEDWEQLLIMSNCDNFIISNSTFSWWGAFLSSSKDKKVCYPYYWFGPNLKHNDTIDLFVPEWKKIFF